MTTWTESPKVLQTFREGTDETEEPCRETGGPRIRPTNERRT